MLSTPTPSPSERHANAAFDALLGALSRPGQIHTLPGPGESAIVDALIDRECRVFCADPLFMPKVLDAGALISDRDQADHVFLGQLQDAGVLSQLCCGSDLYPDSGATVMVSAQLRQGSALRLSGPGVNGTVDVQIDGLPEGFWTQRRDAIRYPMGFDLFLVDGEEVLGVPRSTVVEVL